MFHSSTVTSAFRFLLEKLELETQFYLTSTKILLLEGLNITELCSSSTSAYAKWKINSIFLQPRYYCLKGSTSTTSITQHRNSLPRWMTFLSLDSLNESPFFGTVLHNKFLMEKLGKRKEYILTLSMKSESNPCPIVINSTLISTIITMEVSKLRKKVQKTCFHQKLFRYYLEFFRSTST